MRISHHLQLYFVYLFLLTVLLAGPSLQAQSSPGSQPFEEGLALAKAGAFKRAEAKLLNAIEKDPANPDYHFELGNIYAARYDRLVQIQHPQARLILDRSSREFEQAVMLRPGFEAAHFNLGVVYKRQGRYEEAREQLRRFIELHPDAREGYIQLGMIYEDQGFFDEAEDEYRKALERDFYNSETRSLIEDLEQKRQFARQSDLAGGMRESRLGAQNALFDSAFGRSGAYERDTENVASDGQAIKQAIPYLAQMLARQLLNRFSKPNEE